MPKFKVGDKVAIKSDYYTCAAANTGEGTVSEIRSHTVGYDQWYFVRRDIEGEPAVWYYKEEELTLLPEPNTVLLDTKRLSAALDVLAKDGTARELLDALDVRFVWGGEL